jgi:hypothetical protein
MLPASIQAFTDATDKFPLHKIQAFITFCNDQDVLIAPTVAFDGIQIYRHWLSPV